MQRSLRICVIYKGDIRRKRSFEILFHSSFRGAEIYKACLGLKISKRQKRKCIKELSELGVSFAALPRDLPLSRELLLSGISPVYGSSSLALQIPEMALSLAKAAQGANGFFIRGGSFFTVTRIALRLLEETSSVYVSCADFAAVAEACADMCGAVIKREPPEDVINIFLEDGGFFLKFRERKLNFSDFSISLPSPHFSDIPPCCAAALASALEICGFLGNSEIKTELLPK